MKLSNLLIFNAFVALLFGIGFVLVPGTVLELFDVTPDDSINLVAQFVGVSFIGLGLVTWFARNATDSVALQGIILAQLISCVIGVIVSVMGVSSGAYGVFGWVAVAIYAILSLGFAYFQFLKSPAD